MKKNKNDKDVEKCETCHTDKEKCKCEKSDN